MVKKTVSIAILESNLSVITLTHGNTTTFRSLGFTLGQLLLKGITHKSTP